MQTLQTLVRNLAVILLLATFLEMLLPNKSMRGFVRMMMGLFVISAVLSPITGFLNTPLSMEIPAWTVTTPQDMPALAFEGQGVEAGRDAVQDQYRQILVNQIKALAIGTPGVESVQVEVEFEEGTGGVIDQPNIAGIQVILASDKADIQAIEPIIIGEAPLPMKIRSPRAEMVQERIATFMNLSKEKIFVVEN